MINLLVACDTDDFHLGDYFTKSHEMLIKNISNPNIISKSIVGDNCVSENINRSIVSLESRQFVFVAFSHGSEDDLNIYGRPYINIENCHNFKGALFYTAACYCATNLGRELVNNGCNAFIGYRDKVHIHPEYYDEFIECENYGILEFINTDKSLNDVYNEMHKKYEDVIERLSGGNIKDTLIASTLLENQEQLEILGNIHIKSTDFYYS